MFIDYRNRRFMQFRKNLANETISRPQRFDISAPCLQGSCIFADRNSPKHIRVFRSPKKTVRRSITVSTDLSQYKMRMYVAEFRILISMPFLDNAELVTFWRKRGIKSFVVHSQGATSISSSSTRLTSISWRSMSSWE